MKQEDAYITAATLKLLEKAGVDCKEGLPTQARVMRWLREEYRMHVMAAPYRYPDKWRVMLVYVGQSKEGDDKYDMCNLGKTYSSYEKAAEDGIKWVLKEIVLKIVDNKKREISKK